MHYIYPPVGPTKSPENIRVDRATEKELGLFWEPIPCSDQNGEILYYVIRYHYQVVSEDVQKQESKTYGDQLAIILRNLRSNTEYNVTVAGVNIAGIGTFSSPIVAITLGGKQYMNLVVNCSHGMIVHFY